MVIDCFDSSGVRAALDDASQVKVIVTQRGVLKWERVITAPTPNGTVTVPLQSSDVATVGTYFVKVLAEWPDGSHQHYPPADEYMTMTVTR
jgi:hypothetical protein